MSEQIIELGEDNTITVDGVRYDQETGEILSSEFTIDSPDRARWAAKKVLTWEAQAQALKEQYERDLKAITRNRDGFLNHFGPQLVEFCRQKQAEAGGKGKVSVGYGEVSFTSRKGYWRVSDREAALEFAKEKFPELVSHVIPEPYDDLDSAGYKTAANASEEPLPGTELVPAKLDSYLALGGLDAKVKLSDYGMAAKPEEETS